MSDKPRNDSDTKNAEGEQRSNRVDAHAKLMVDTTNAIAGRDQFRNGNIVNDTSAASGYLDMLRGFQLVGQMANSDNRLESALSDKDGKRVGSKFDALPIDQINSEIVSKFLSAHPAASRAENYPSLVDSSTKLIMADNLTHLVSHKYGAVLNELIDQFSTATPPAKLLGLEGFQQSWQRDFDNFFTNPDGKNSRGEAYKDIVAEHAGSFAKTLGQSFSRSPADIERYSKEIISNIEEAQKKGVRVVCLEPDNRGLWEDPHSSAPHYEEALQQLVQLSPDKNGESLLDKYQRDAPEARKQLVDYLTKNPVSSPQKFDNDGDSAKAAEDIVLALDAMKTRGFNFSSKPTGDGTLGLPLDANGKLDRQLYERNEAEWRSQSMAKIVDAAMQTLSNGERMIISAGDAHFGYNLVDGGGIKGPKTMTEMLRSKYSSVVFGFNDGTDPKKGDNSPDEKLFKAIETYYPSGHRAVIPLSGNSKPYDYYIHLDKSE